VILGKTLYFDCLILITESWNMIISKLCVSNQQLSAFPYTCQQFPIRLLGTRFKARNCICESATQEPYRVIF
jgi:hypothetical protein